MITAVEPGATAHDWLDWSPEQCGGTARVKSVPRRIDLRAGDVLPRLASCQVRWKSMALRGVQRPSVVSQRIRQPPFYKSFSEAAAVAPGSALNHQRSIEGPSSGAGAAMPELGARWPATARGAAVPATLSGPAAVRQGSVVRTVRRRLRKLARFTVPARLKASVRTAPGRWSKRSSRTVVVSSIGHPGGRFIQPPRGRAERRFERRPRHRCPGRGPELRPFLRRGVVSVPRRRHPRARSATAQPGRVGGTATAHVQRASNSSVRARCAVGAEP